MIKHKVLEFTLIKMVRDTRVAGLMIYKMVSGEKFGLMVQDLKVIIKMGKNMDLV